LLLDGSLLTEGRAGSTVQGVNPNAGAIRPSVMKA
jgi:hypothetical protein